MQSCQEKKHFPVKQIEQEPRIQTWSMRKPTWTERMRSAGGRRKQRSVQAVGGSSVSRAFIRGKMCNKNGMFCLNHHLQARNFFLCLCSCTIDKWLCSSRVDYLCLFQEFGSIWMLSVRAVLGIGVLVTSRVATALAQTGTCPLSFAANSHNKDSFSSRPASTMAQTIKYLGWSLKSCTRSGETHLQPVNWHTDAPQAGGGPAHWRGALQWVRLQRGPADGAGRTQLCHSHRQGEISQG